MSLGRLSHLQNKGRDILLAVNNIPKMARVQAYALRLYGKKTLLGKGLFYFNSYGDQLRNWLVFILVIGVLCFSLLQSYICC